MNFREWFEQFFRGMDDVPDHAQWAYQAAYDTGVEEGQKVIKCPGCEGKKVVQTRVQITNAGGRFCVDEEKPCPVCKGNGIATKEHLAKFFRGE